MLEWDAPGEGKALSNIKKDMPESFDPKVADARMSKKPEGEEEQESGMFGKSLGSDEARIDRLENAVQRMHEDLDEVMPSIRRLSGMEEDIQDLVAQLQKLLLEPKSLNVDMQTLMTEPKPLSVDKQAEIVEQKVAKASAQNQNNSQQIQAQKPQPKSQPSSNTTPQGPMSIRNVRIADYVNKTRIVFDSAEEIKYDFDFDTAEKIIFMNTNAKSVNANSKSLAKKSPVITSVHITQQNAGTNIVIALEAWVTVTKPKLLKPNPENRNYRYFFDIMK